MSPRQAPEEWTHLELLAYRADRDRSEAARAELERQGLPQRLEAWPLGDLYAAWLSETPRTRLLERYRRAVLRELHRRPAPVSPREPGPRHLGAEAAPLAPERWEAWLAGWRRLRRGREAAAYLTALGACILGPLVMLGMIYGLVLAGWIARHVPSPYFPALSFTLRLGAIVGPLAALAAVLWGSDRWWRRRRELPDWTRAGGRAQLGPDGIRLDKVALGARFLAWEDLASFRLPPRDAPWIELVPREGAPETQGVWRFFPFPWTIPTPTEEVRGAVLRVLEGRDLPPVSSAETAHEEDPDDETSP